MFPRYVEDQGFSHLGVLVQELKAARLGVAHLEALGWPSLDSWLPALFQK